MARNRELSQLGSIINVKDSNQNIGIGTTNPAFKFDVHGDINSTTEAVSYTHLTLPTILLV